MGQANSPASTPFEESHPNTPTTCKRLKTRRPVTIPSDAAARLTEVPSVYSITTQHETPQENMTVATATRSSTRLQMKRRCPKKAYCCYPIHKGKHSWSPRKIATPTKTLVRAAVAAPVKCITNANALCSARKRHSGGPSFASKRSLKFGIKTLPKSLEQLENSNEQCEWQDIEEISCEQTADELEQMFYALQHTEENNELPDLSLLSNCLEAELHQAEQI
jgi:YesN/AraC family two-component response regulator